MNQQTAGSGKHRTAEQMIDAVFALDLDPIKFKLMDAKEGHGWTREEADRHELEYRRFLALVAKYPEEAITPDASVDKFWHGHILDTMKYAVDCERVFGYFLHHFPYFGMRGDEDAANLAEAAAKTRSLYQQEFGHLDAADGSYCARVAEPEAAYCARVAVPQSSYCARAVTPEVAYCARAAAPAVSAMSEASYCARAAAPTETGTDTYCAAAKPAATPAYLAKVLGKGRPALDSAVTR